MPYPKYWDDVMEAFATKRAMLAAFPQPTYSTVAAAEVIKTALLKAGTGQAPYGRTMACGIVHIRDETAGRQNFVLSFSGHHPNLQLNIGTLNGLLATAIKRLPPIYRARNPRFWYQVDMSPHYIPMHQQTQDYFKEHLGVDVKSARIHFKDLAPHFAFAAWKDLVFEGRQYRVREIGKTVEIRHIKSRNGPRKIPIERFEPVLGAREGVFQFNYKGTQTRPKKNDLKKMHGNGAVNELMYNPRESFHNLKSDITAVITKTMCSFLAIRMDLVAPVDVPKAVKAARRFIRDARETTDPMLVKFANYLEQVLVTPKMTRAQLQVEEKLTAMREMKRKAMVALGSGKFRTFDNRRTTGDLASSRADLVDELQNDPIMRSVLPAVWVASGGGPYGQFCAEPKACDLARNGFASHDVKVAGQAAFWYSGEEKNFSSPLMIYGPENAVGDPASGGYMSPCTSCAARSAIMLVGMDVLDPELYVG